MQINYLSAGTKTIQIDIKLTNGTHLATQSTLEVENALRVEFPITENGSVRVDSLRFEASISFQGYDESAPEKGSGDALFYYAEGRSQLRKPFIVIDGFDLGDKDRKAGDLYERYLQYTNATGSEVNLGNILRTNTPGNGYDVIVLNFPLYEEAVVQRNCIRRGNGRPCQTAYVSVVRDGGADFIERNAFVLVELIQRINNQLRANGSNEK